MCVKHEHYEMGCENCGFYNDCPIDYECPALETLNRLRSRNGFVTIRNGNFYGIFEEDSEE